MIKQELKKLKEIHESFPTAGLSDSFSVPEDAIGDVISRKFFNKFRIPHSFVFLPHLELQHSDFPMFNVMVT